MGKYDSYEVQGDLREETLRAIDQQLKQWGLTLPSVEPIPLDFGLGVFREIGETEFWIANEEKSGYCGKLLFLLDGQTCPYHSHAIKHETFFVVKGSIRMNTEGRELLLSEGDTLPMPPNNGHSFTGVGNALVLEVSMPSILNDNFFSDKRIGEDGVI